MINKEEQTIKTLDTLPNSVEFDAEYVEELLKESKEDLKSGRVKSVEEAIEKMQKKYDEFYVDYMKKLLKESEEQLKNGEVITLEELRTYIDELEGKYANNI